MNSKQIQCFFVIKESAQISKSLWNKISLPTFSICRNHSTIKSYSSAVVSQAKFFFDILGFMSLYLKLRNVSTHCTIKLFHYGGSFDSYLVVVSSIWNSAMIRTILLTYLVLAHEYGHKPFLCYVKTCGSILLFNNP